jgi:AcrR family transcriptional regulator
VNPALPRAKQKLQTRYALMAAAHTLMDSGRGFCSLSLREVTRTAGIVPTGFYRHFADMDALGLALVDEVGDTFRETIGKVRHHRFEQNGMIDASVRIFLDAVAASRSQFLFLAREQFGGSHAIRQALSALREHIATDLAADLATMAKLEHLDTSAQIMLSDLVVKSVFATLPELIDPPAYPLPHYANPETKMIEQLRFIFIGAKHWEGLKTPAQ